MLRITTVFISGAACCTVALLAATLAGCGAKATPRVNGSGTENPNAISAPGPFELPAPDQLIARLTPPRSSSYTPIDLFRDGSSYEDLLPWNRVTRDAPSVVLNSNASGSAGGLGDLSYAIWRFNVLGYDGAPKLRPVWGTPPADSDCVWLGVANFTSQTWDWFSCAPGLSANLGDTAPYIDVTGNMLAVVLLTGVNAGSLLRLRLGDLVFEGKVTVFPQAGMSPLDARFDAALVPIGANALNYLWDLDGDGVFETDSGADSWVIRQYTMVGQTVAAVRITTDEGLAPPKSAPPVRVLNGTWEITTLADPPSSSFTYEYPQIAIVGGRPGVALLEYVAPDPEFLPNGSYTALYYAASDAQATSWSGASVPASDAYRPVQLGDLLEVNGAPALCYRDQFITLVYVRAADAAGSSWNAPQTIGADARDTFYASMAIVGGDDFSIGRPAIAYSYEGTTGFGLGYLQANDIDGSSWSERQDIRSNVSYQVSLRAGDGMPAIAYYDMTADRVQALKAIVGYPDGTYDWTDLVAGTFSSGGYAVLGELNGRLVIGMQRNIPPDAVAIVWTAADAQGSGPWQSDYIDFASNPTGYSLSFAGPCLDHDGVSCYQAQGSNAPGLWLSYLDCDFGSVSSAAECVDAGSNVGYNCEMIVCEGVPMIVYEDRNWGSVKLAVLR